MKLDTRTKLFIILTGIFVTALVVGDILGGKLMQHTARGVPFVISVAMIPFPVTFLLTDLLNEFYGKRAARFVTWVGFFMATFSYTLIVIAVKLPWAPFTYAPDWRGMNETAFNNIFSGSQRMIIASMAAYLVAQFFDIAMFHFIKRRTGSRLLWLRASGSTVFSQLIDTVVVQTVAWTGIMSTGKILSIIVTSYVVKLLIAIGLTPVIYAGHAIVERWLGIEPIRLDSKGEIAERMPTIPASA